MTNDHNDRGVGGGLMVEGGGWKGNEKKEEKIRELHWKVITFVASKQISRLSPRADGNIFQVHQNLRPAQRAKNIEEVRLWEHEKVKR